MSSSNRPYRLGLDLGSNSIGWFVIWLDDASKPCGLGPGGVHIFSDGRNPQSKTSNAATRRVPRSMRRRRDRYLKRRARLMSQLVEFGLMPTGEAERKKLERCDPYKLRAYALDHRLPLHHVGRAMLHLNQRRGYRSNRKTDGADNESGPIKEAIGKLEQAMKAEGARTLGEFLWHLHRERQGVRVRNSGTTTKVAYDFYPLRTMLEKEFDAIWAAQAHHHPEMTEKARDALYETIFYQRPLHEQPIGKCALDPAEWPDDTDGFRLSRAHPLAQRFRILQEVNNLEYGEIGRDSIKLSDEQRETLVLALVGKNKLSFDRMRTLLKLPQAARFNLESDKRKALKGDETAAKLSHKDLFGKQWRTMDRARQCTAVERLLATHDEDDMIAWLVGEAGLDEATAQRVSSATLPAGHARLGRRAIERLLPRMEAGRRYDEAATDEYGSHSEKRTGEVVARLPYYGAWMRDAVTGSGDQRDSNQKHWGRLPNPTVHIGLGQLRRIVNAIAKEYGPPKEAVAEMTRNFKLSPTKVRELEREQTANQEKNEKRDRDIKSLRHVPNARNRLKMRLWEELNPDDSLDRCCPFTGEKISIQRLFSEEVEIEHLIPFSTSWDDSAANKVIAMRYANRAKGQKTPFDAFGHSPTISGHRYDWEAITQRAANLPKNKSWRFASDAADRFGDQNGFLNRQLNETGWFARLAKDYVEGLTGPYKVWVVPGRLTEMIRAKWGLNSLLPDHNFTDRKNRADHRHHAIDALVAGLTDRSLLQAMASAYDDERNRIAVPEPWETLRQELGGALDTMTVSHRPDHSASGKLHEATAYGTVKFPEREGANLVYRKELTALTKREIGRIRDVRLRNMVEVHVGAEAAKGKVLNEALESFNAAHEGHPHVKEGLRRVRILKSEKPDYLIAVGHGKRRHTKAYSAGENAFVDIFETPDGKWSGEATSVFQANKSCHRQRWRNTDAAFVMRVRKGDLIALDHDGTRQVMVVHRLDAAAKRFKLAAHNETGNLDKRHAESCDIDPFRWLMASYGTLKERGAERVRVDELGRVWRIPPDEAARSP
ncbi:MAG: type II CRISPR RNA-guided endonuclease Cas9 [Gemmatimonadota bacterium]|nr:type II CRISPR RNA-guided endonuclease Cas9 [Gemmatimonadota bacterium]